MYRSEAAWTGFIRAILDVLLLGPRRKVNKHDDLLTAGFSDVAGLVLHVGSLR
jgi:hypothetical protein